MYFAALKRAIQALEEKRFYDIALMYLSACGYKELSIVDGTGDGGRDVICSRKDLRIQLSVRKDWEVKVNHESDLTKAAEKHHFVYVTNRKISEVEKQRFLTTKHKNSGDVDIVFHDLNRISTTLAQPGTIEKAYAALGMSVDTRLRATEKDIAISTVMLFSKEAQDFRANIIDSNVRAWLLKNGPASQEQIVAAVGTLLPYPNVEHDISRTIGRMRATGRILDSANAIFLAESEAAIAKAAEEEFLQSTSADVALLQTEYGLGWDDAINLLKMALELTARDKPLDDRGELSDALAVFVAEKGLTQRRAVLYETLSKTSMARLEQYGRTVERIFSTNTFDIYRALGRRTSITMVLDASVAMPMLCGLAFRTVRSRFGVAAMALRTLCEQHEIKIEVPSFYVNEMASHGLKALDFLATYENLPSEAKAAFIGSGNAYLSHYARINESMTNAGEDPPSLEEFLDYFGFTARTSLHSAENKVTSLLDKFGIKTINFSNINMELRERVKNAKGDEHTKIIDHDAMAITMFMQDTESGFVFATWDNVLIDMVAEIDRIYADTPSRVIDFLSMAASADYECEQSIELLTSLIHCDEAKASALAQKIERIESVEQAFRFQRFIDEARTKAGPDWHLTDREVDAFFRKDARNLAS
ncbi:hypothetical protein [Chromobacterium violaceum]|uniref:hypothetical protein n=1 Tax=Chromobacterium violaceum TaxID=536 RepID=UPI00194FEF28|nr:hypothetical protein [Chromobacterium violaceum]QRO35470.1 hypothetical protein I6K04_22605 [Chromobacterium violaceum]QRQ19385.1 hypothetical protein I6K03_22645 [Chromobacterium violaceum]